MKDVPVVTNSHILFSLLAIISISMFGVYLDDNLSLMVLTLIYIILGIVISYILNIRGDIKNSIYVFFLFFGIYLLYTTVVHFGLINFYDVTNISSDEIATYAGSNDVYRKLEIGYDFSDIANIREYKESPIVRYFNGYIATIANYYGENSILFQKVGVVLFASLIPMVMYGISRLYFSEKISIRIAIIYGLFSFVPYLSSTLLRDIHVALMYIITFYIVLQRLSIINLFTLIFVSIISYYLRVETGMFMIGFIVIYIFVFIENSIKNRYIRLFIYLSSIAIATIIIFNSPLMDSFEQILTSSNARSAESASSGSMGAKIAKLPYGINIITLLGFSQIQPFPPIWIFQEPNRGVFELVYLIAGISWFMGWGFLIYGVFAKKIFNKLELKLQLMSILSILYLVLIAVIEFNQRRQMAVYPMLYMVMIFSYLDMSVTERTKIWVGMILFYITLVLVINFLKI